MILNTNTRTIRIGREKRIAIKIGMEMITVEISKLPKFRNPEHLQLKPLQFQNMNLVVNNMTCLVETEEEAYSEGHIQKLLHAVEEDLMGKTTLEAVLEEDLVGKTNLEEGEVTEEDLVGKKHMEGVTEEVRVLKVSLIVQLLREVEEEEWQPLRVKFYY